MSITFRKLADQPLLIAPILSRMLVILKAAENLIFHRNGRKDQCIGRHKYHNCGQAGYYFLPMLKLPPLLFIPIYAFQRIFVHVHSPAFLSNCPKFRERPYPE